MARQVFSKTTNLKVIGVLDKNEDDKYIVTVEGNNGTYKEYKLEDILEDICGTEITISSVEELI